MSELKIGALVETINIPEPDDICHDGMVGKVIGYDSIQFNGDYPWVVEFKVGKGSFPASELKVLSEVQP